MQGMSHEKRYKWTPFHPSSLELDKNLQTPPTTSPPPWHPCLLAVYLTYCRSIPSLKRTIHEPSFLGFTFTFSAIVDIQRDLHLSAGSLVIRRVLWPGWWKRNLTRVWQLIYPWPDAITSSVHLINTSVSVTQHLLNTEDAHNCNDVLIINV